MRVASHPIWLAGFRPLFTLACLSGMALPVLWASMFSGVLVLPDAAVAPVAWHAHEMFYGFGWALLGGFLLTASKNWVGVRGYHGPMLMALAALWLLERLALWTGAGWPAPVFALTSNAFLVVAVGMLLVTLIANRNRDSFKDNGFFIVALPLFLIAKNLLLSPDHFGAGWGMTLALFRLAFVIMLERTLTQFMRGAFQVSLVRTPRLDYAIKGLALVMVAEPFMPAWPAAGGSAVLAALLLLRFVLWHPHLGLRRIELGVMYLGQVGMVLQLAAQAADRVTTIAWVGSVSAHLFTFGVMGLIIPVMITRIAKGHTGRKVIFDGIDRLALWAMVLAFVLRVVAPQVEPSAYIAWIHASASCWLLCFGLLGARYIPFLVRPRIDGRDH